MSTRTLLSHWWIEMSKLVLKICAFLFNTSVDLFHESPTTFSCCNIISRQWWSNVTWFMNEKLFNRWPPMTSHSPKMGVPYAPKILLILNYLKFHHIIHDTTASMHQQVPYVLAKNDILGSRLIACCKLAPTLARQIWRHNYVIVSNKYLISTLSESTVP